ncbi:ABC transporter ATP-binding protein/permease [Nonomuraea sp. NBC_01738]|uniref:ABC transporter ATP-binding protein n=1 Tax=Nonomuraea sp. NBC_01738 TaxID=2976003 RepID=UPI002E0F7713|nr:ABC transporter ATP-binding protein/permease [Nonomuraea sp. NBC_01738]
MILQTLRLADDRRAVLRYLLLAGLSAVVRAGAILSLVPLLGALFSAAPGDAVPWVVALAVLVSGGWAVDYAVAGAGFTIGFELLSSMERRVVDRLGRIPLGWFTAERKAEGQRALTSSGRELCQGVAHLLTPAASALVTPALIGAGLLLIAPPLGLVALAAVLLLLAAVWASVRCLNTADDAYAVASGEAGQRIIELAQAQPALRSAGRTGSEGSAIGAALRAQRTAALRLIGFSLPGQAMFGLVTQAALLGLAATAVVLGADGALSGAEVVALVIVTVRFIEPFLTLAELFPAMQAMRGTLTRVHALLDAPSLAVEGGHAVPDPDAPALELRDVRFGYEPGAEIARGVSVTVARGTTTAIVGASGAGKSTLLALVARFHDVTGGAVVVAGHDVRAYDPPELMSRLGIVFQDVYLFDASLYDNIRLGDPAAPDEAVRAAASAAQLDEVVGRLPDGWETRVGERGASLSGGERQRVSIARALLKNAPLLLLDEATAALDTANERALIAALEPGGGQRATVIVAHRLSTIARADQIVFLEEGRVAEAGTVRELLALNGRFAAYWEQRERAADWTITV